MGPFYVVFTMDQAEKSVAIKDRRAWDALSPPLADWILDGVRSMGFECMTPVQADTIPLFLKNRDVVVEVGLFVDLDAYLGITHPNLTTSRQ